METMAKKMNGETLRSRIGIPLLSENLDLYADSAMTLSPFYSSAVYPPDIVIQLTLRRAASKQAETFPYNQ